MLVRMCGDERSPVNCKMRGVAANERVYTLRTRPPSLLPPSPLSLASSGDKSLAAHNTHSPSLERLERPASQPAAAPTASFVCYVCGVGAPSSQLRLVYCCPNPEREPYYPFITSLKPHQDASPISPQGMVQICASCYKSIPHKYPAYGENGEPNAAHNNSHTNNIRFKPYDIKSSSNQSNKRTSNALSNSPQSQIVSGENGMGLYRATSILATAAVDQVVGRIRSLGLEVALQKSEAICFYGPRKAPPADSHIVVGGVHISVRPTLKYLGFVLDSRWDFEPHLGWSRRPGCCRSSSLPQTAVYRDHAVHGALWRPDMGSDQGLPHDFPRFPGFLKPESSQQAQLYMWRSQIQTQGSDHSLREKWDELRTAAMTDWLYSLESPTAGHELVAAIRPVFWDWLERRHGGLMYRLTQVLTGHGCFGKYLCRIGRELTEGRDLVANLGELATVRSESAWQAVADYCETTMTAKEVAERERESTSEIPSRRRRRRRRRNDLRPP
ncbi:unnamed protein product [Chrysodeixis includens]|uniref:Uncharacterized protein n=1 Tax=Chrysodeixis includens TaxID=689277 RepID=A0A9N8L467_CHRIL|nr:unnamed protein product [Chrysodeixis includens]